MSDSQLTEEQLRVKSLMLSLGQKIQASPLAIGQIIEDRKLNNIDLDRLYLSTQLVQISRELENAVFHPIEDDRTRAAAKSAFHKLLVTESQACPEIVGVLEEHGIRKFHMNMRAAMLRQNMPG